MVYSYLNQVGTVNGDKFIYLKIEKTVFGDELDMEYKWKRKI